MRNNKTFIPLQEKIKQIRIPEIFEEHIRDVLIKWLLFVQVGIDSPDSVVNEIKEIFISKTNVYDVEECLNKYIWGYALNSSVEKGLREEEEMVFKEVEPHLIKGNALDVGTGSGIIAQKINNAGYPMTIIDVIDFNKSTLKSNIYDGVNIPFPDNSYDNVTLLTVLHHCDNYMNILDEAIRVCNKNLIVIESVYIDQHEYYCNIFFDWLWNRVVYRDVNCPFHFHMPDEWEKIFIDKGMKIHESIDLGYDSPMTPEHHWLFVLKII